MKALVKIMSVVALSFIVSACGYRMSPHSYIMGHIKTVYVQNPTNTTNRPDLDIYFLKQALLKDLSLEPNIKAVSKSSDAQGYIEINVINYSVEPSSFDKNGIASRYRCTITVNLTLKTKDGKTPISNKALTSFEDFDASNDTNAIEISKQSVQKKVLANLALLIREELFINF